MLKVTYLNDDTLHISYKEPRIPFIGLYITTVLSKTGDSYSETKQSFTNKRERVAIDLARIDNVSIYTYYATEKDGAKVRTSGVAINYSDATTFAVASGHYVINGSIFRLLENKRPQPLINEAHQIATFLDVPFVNTDETVRN